MSPIGLIFLHLLALPLVSGGSRPIMDVLNAVERFLPLSHTYVAVRAKLPDLDLECDLAGGGLLSDHGLCLHRQHGYGFYEFNLQVGKLSAFIISKS